MRFDLKKVSTTFVFAGLGLLAGILAARADPPFMFPSITPDPNPIQLTFSDGENFTFLKTAATTGGLYTLASDAFPPGGGPLPHIHHHDNEWMYVVSGQVEIDMGDNLYPNIDQVPGINLPKETLYKTVAGPGTLVYMPEYHVHTFVNVGDTMAVILAVWAPGGIEGFFEAAQGTSAQQTSEIGLQYGLDGSTYPSEYVSKILPGMDMTDNQSQGLLSILTGSPPNTTEAPYETHQPAPVYRPSYPQYIAPGANPFEPRQ